MQWWHFKVSNTIFCFLPATSSSHHATLSNCTCFPLVSHQYTSFLHHFKLVSHQCNSVQLFSHQYNTFQHHFRLVSHPVQLFPTPFQIGFSSSVTLSNTIFSSVQYFFPLVSHHSNTWFLISTRFCFLISPTSASCCFLISATIDLWCNSHNHPIITHTVRKKECKIEPMCMYYKHYLQRRST